VYIYTQYDIDKVEKSEQVKLIVLSLYKNRQGIGNLYIYIYIQYDIDKVEIVGNK